MTSQFRLVNFLEDTALNGLRFDMGASLVRDYKGHRQIRLMDEDAVRRLGREGIDIDDFSEVKVEHDGTLSYKGKRIVVYIRDVKQYSASQDLPKYHFAYCRTLETMQQRSRWGRYVVANRDDGSFFVNFVGSHSRDVRLNVCQNCLAHVGWDGFEFAMSWPTKNAIVKAFTLARFFEEFPKDLLSVLPTYTVDTAPVNDYSDDWGMISEKLKRDRRYKCEKCSRQFQGANRRYVHVHHRDGQKNNNHESNLAVLCIECHADEPMHGHMKQLRSYTEFVAQFSAGREGLPSASSAIAGNFA